MTKIQKALRNKKGFTLVELLVVLVILAILAAAIIPSMMGFIDKAKEESAAAECRSVILAADVVMNEEYGKGTLTAGAKDAATDFTKAVQKISDLKGTINSVTVSIDSTNGHGTVTAASYTASNGGTYNYDGTKWTKSTAAVTSVVSQ